MIECSPAGQLQRMDRWTVFIPATDDSKIYCLPGAARIVIKTKGGREKRCTLRRAAIKKVGDWAFSYRHLETELEKLDGVANQMKKDQLEKEEARDDKNTVNEIERMVVTRMSDARRELSGRCGETQNT